MPSEFEEIFAGAQEFIEAAEGQTFQWNGQTYQCTAGETMIENDYETAGVRRRLVVTIEATLSQFGEDLPATGQLLVYDGSTYTVPQEVQQDGVSIRFRAFRPIF